MIQITSITHIRDDWKFDLEDIEKMINITTLPFRLDYLTIVCRDDDEYPDDAFTINGKRYITLNVHPAGDVAVYIKDRLRDYAQTAVFKEREPAECMEDEDFDDR